MANDKITLRDIVQTEAEQLESFGDAAEGFFHSLASDIKQEFTSTLNELITHDLVQFQSQVSRQTNASGFGQVGTALGGAVGSVIDGIFPETIFGDVYGAAVGGALRTVLGDFFGRGSVDWRRAITSANRTGSSELDRMLRRPGTFSASDMTLSRGQRAAQGLHELHFGRRNT